MSKKVILGTLLASATLLGASAGHAATSDIKSESKKVTVTSDKAKLYKDSTMKESTTAKKGSVYQVDGYRDINGKHVYRLYQKDKYDKNQYKGYLVSTDAKELKSDTAKGQYVAKKGATMWENFYWNNKREVTNQEKVFFAKYSYTLGDGAKYYSMYYKNEEGKDTWAGYTNASNVQELKATEETKYVTLKKDYSTWANLYFKQHKDDFKAEKGVNFKVKRYYTLNGNKFYSTYRTDADGKEVWTGYVNGYSSVIEDLKAEKVDEKDQKVQVVKDYNTYSNHFFNKKGQLSKDKIVTMKLTYTYGNGKKYASLYDGDTWLGYANVDAVKSASALLDDANKAIEDAKDKLKGNTIDSQNAINDAIKGVEDAIKSNDAAKIKDSVDKLKEAVDNAQPVATSADMERLNEAIQIGQKYVGSADHTTDRKALDEAIENAKKVQEAAKKDNASSKDVDDAIKAIDDAIKGIKPGETSANKEEVQKLKAAIKLLQDVNKIGADKLENDGNYDTVLQGAEDVLKVAEEGKATQDQIDAAVKSVEEFINGLSLNNSDLEKFVNEIKDLGSKVYMTKTQEEKFNEFITQSEEAVKDTKLSNVEKLKEINNQAKKAKEFVAGQPTEKDVKELIAATKEEQKIETETKGKQEQLFDGWNTVEEKDKAADAMLENIKKDNKDDENTADKEYTAKDVQNTAGELKQAISALTVNKENTTKFYNAAKEKIDGLIDNGTAKADLEKFENQLKSDHSINNYPAIIQTAKETVKAIQEAEKSSQAMYKSLDEAIAKAKPYNGGKTENNPAIPATEETKELLNSLEEKEPKTVKPYYEADTYDKFASALGKAVEIKQATMPDNAPKDEKESKETTSYHKAEVEEATKALTEATEGLRFNKTAMQGINEEANKYVKEYVSTLGATKRAQTAIDTLNETLADDADMKPTQENKQTLRDQENMVVTKAEELKTKGVAKQATADKLKAGLEQAKPAYETQTADAGSGDAKQSYQIFDKTTNEAFRKAFVDSSSTYERLSKEDATKDSDVANDLKELKEKGEGLHLNQKALENAITRAQKFYEGTLPKVEKQAAESAEKKALKSVIDEANTFKSTKSAYFTSEVTENHAKEVNQEIGKLYDATKAYEQSLTTITTDKATLESAPKLTRAILESPKSSEKAKELATVVKEGAYPVDTNSTGNKEKSIAGLENNKAWTDFGGQGNGSYYDAMKKLQDYAKDTTSVDDKAFTSEETALKQNMDDLVVLTDQLQAALDDSEKAETESKIVDKLSLDSVQEAAQTIISKKQTGIENWKKINQLTAQLKEAAQKLTEMIKK